MAPLIDDTGELSYNTVEFQQFFSTKVSARPIYSESGRVVKSVEHTITIDAVVVPSETDDLSQTTDNRMADLRRLLLAPGKQLRFNLRGYGPLNVNVPEGLRDVDWGPKPRSFAAHPVGHDRAWRVQWSVSTCIPEGCENARSHGLMAMEYETSFDLDVAGAYTITHTGYVEIAQTRLNGGNKVQKTADAFREEVNPAVPLGFERVVRRYSTNKSKNRMDWTITDKQVFKALPAGFTSGDIEHSIESGIQDGFQNWRCAITGSLTLPMGVNKADAYDAVMPLILSKARTTLIKGRKVIMNANRPKTVLPTLFRIKDGYRQNRIQFEFHYRVCGASLSEMLRKSGLFQELPGVNFRVWRDSLTEENGAWTPRGPANIALNPRDDELYDLCSNKVAPPVPQIEVDEVKPGGNFLAGLSRDNIDEDNSWLFFECSLTVESNWGVAVGKVLRNFGIGAVAGRFITGLLAGAGANPGVAAAAGTAFGGPVLGDAAANIVTQITAAPLTTLVIKGRAVRLFYPVEPPGLDTFNGMKVGSGQGDIKELRRNVKSRRAGGWAEAPINVGSWQIVYALPRPLSGDAKLPQVLNYSLNIPGVPA